jgi:hypothetical protein
MGLSLGLGMIAGTIGVPEVAIDDTEATAITKAIARLARYYDLGVSGPVGAWMGLAGVLGPICGAHYVAYRMRLSAAGEAVAHPQGPIGAQSAKLGPQPMGLAA